MRLEFEFLGQKANRLLSFDADGLIDMAK